MQMEKATLNFGFGYQLLTLLIKALIDHNYYIYSNTQWPITQDVHNTNIFCLLKFINYKQGLVYSPQLFIRKTQKKKLVNYAALLVKEKLKGLAFESYWCEKKSTNA